MSARGREWDRAFTRALTVPFSSQARSGVVRDLDASGGAVDSVVVAFPHGDDLVPKLWQQTSQRRRVVFSLRLGGGRDDAVANRPYSTTRLG